MGLRKNKYMTGMSSRKNAMKSLSVAALVGAAFLGATNSAVLAEDTTTTITTTLPNGTEQTLTLQTTYGDSENADSSTTSEVKVLGQPVTYTYNYDSSTILPRQTSFNGENINGNFIGNYITSPDSNAYGGAIYNFKATIGNITGDFIGNYAYSSSSNLNSYAYGGAIYNYRATIGDITGDFIGNYAKSETNQASGGAIYNSNYTSIGDITGDFIGNYAYSSSSNSYANGGAIYIDSWGTIGDITGDFIGNYASSNGAAWGGAISNQVTIGNIAGDFIGNYASANQVAYGGAIHNELNSIDNITGNFIGNYAIANAFAQGGAISNINATAIITNSNFTDNYVKDKYEKVQGGAIYNGNYLENSLTIINSSFTGNYAKSENGIAQGGAIYSSDTDLNIISKDGHTSVFSGNYTESNGVKDDNAITSIGGALNFQMLNGGKFLMQDNIIAGGSIEDFYTDFGVTTFDEYAKNDGFKDTPTETFLSWVDCSTVDEFAQQEGYQNIDELLADWGYESFDEFLKEDVGLAGNSATEQLLNDYGCNSVEEFLADEGYGPSTVNIQGDDINNTTFYLYNDINFANVNIGNTTINTVNNLAHTYNFNSLTLTADTNMVVDVDLVSQTMDRFSAKSYGEHQGSLNVTGMNLLSDATEDTTKILFAENGLKDNVTTTVTEVAYTPIYKYSVSYDKSGEDGYFVFTRPTSSGSGGTGSAESFNPAVLGSSSSATVGALGTMNQTMNNVFQHSDNYMHIPYLERVSMKNRNKYALSLTGDATDMGRYSPLYQRSQEQASVWVKPYATFENVPLKNGPKVSNITYGTLVGFDTEMQSLRNGWDRVFTGYIGYNGASQRYSGIDSTQNGGLIGGTMTLYKGNFFNATTVSVGANVAQNQTMYGSEDFAMLLSGIGNKTGYNFEFKEGKLILQPSMLMSYTFVNTFDYTNAAGVRIDNKPLHALQLAPGVKVIGNLKNGWQPYASVSMVWNLMGESDATANGVKLPEMSIKPYVQYGVGLQKRIKDHFTAYGQAMIQNGGRNGISLTAGFRWALGKDKDQKVQKDKTTDKIANDKKILKQMTPSQKAAHGGKYASTTRSAKAGMLRQL